MLNIKQIQIMSIALLVVATTQGMQTPKIIGEIQVDADTEMCFIGKKEYEAIQKMGIPQSSFGNSMPAVKVECFVQQGGEEYNWTEGELEPAFPQYVPASLLWGLEADSKISFKTKINGQPTAIKLYVRDNFETDKSIAGQMTNALKSFVQNAHVKSDDDATQQFFLEQELIKKGLIRQVIEKDATGQFLMKNLHTTGLGHKSIFEDILNQPGKDEAIQKALSKGLLNNEERQEVLSLAVKQQSQNMVHLLRNREIGRK